MKLLCAVSALDIGLNYGCTPAWWQYFKGLHELGHEVIVIPYAGSAVATPWWRAYPNPCQTEGNAFAWLKKQTGGAATSLERNPGSAATKWLIERWVRPRWHAQLRKILAAERNVDAVISLNIPPNHFAGVPEQIRAEFAIPFFFFDGDVPASLPEFGGFASGFSGYDGADISEYDGIMCNSTAGAESLTEMGARRVATIHWGVDPELYTPISLHQEFDVFFYGYGVEYREDWFENMLVAPSQSMDATFALGGKGFPPTPLQLRYVGNVPFNALRQACARSRINLNISRHAHASVFGSSTLRLFELAAMGCCIVTNPHAGIESWFDTVTSLRIVTSAEEAVETYRSLLADSDLRESMGKSARERVVEAHTHRHRAAEIISFVS